MVETVIQISSIIFCGLIILVLCMFCITNFYIKYYNFKVQRYQKYCIEILKKPVNTWTKIDFKVLNYIGHNLLLYLTPELAKNTKQIILEKILLPWARRHYKRHNWQSRYQSATIFSMCFLEQDYDYIKALIQDKVLPVSLVALQAVLKNPNPSLTKLIIKVLAESRSVRQSFLIEFIEQQIITLDHQIIAEAILNELTKDQNQYNKIFCYHWLVRLHINLDRAMVQATKDSKSNNMNLKIAACHYLAMDKKYYKYLVENLEDVNWQVRVAAIHDLMLSPQKKLPALLTKQLQHPEWWVRHTAQHALQQLQE